MTYDHWKTTDPRDREETYSEEEPACQCGNPASWHGDTNGRRVFCCDSCFESEVGASEPIEITRADGSTYTAYRLACGCVGSCDPYAHDTAWDWDGRHDAIYPSRVHYSPYIIDEEYSGWVIYNEDDLDGNNPLIKFTSLEAAKDWVDLEAEGQ